MRRAVASLVGLVSGHAALFEGLVDEFNQFNPRMDSALATLGQHHVVFLELSNAAVVGRSRTMRQRIVGQKANSTAGVDANATADANANMNTKATANVDTKSTLAVETNSSVAAAVNASGALSQGANALAAEAQKQKMIPKPWFAVTLSIALVVKTLCMLSNVVYQCSPIPAVKQFSESGDTGKMDGAPYMSIMYGGCQWCFYGYYAYSVTQKSGFLVLVYSNFLGAILGVYYVFHFIKHCQTDEIFKRVVAYLRIAAVLVLVQGTAMAVLPCQKSLLFCGLISSVCASLGALSLLATVPEVLESRCSSTIDSTMVSIGYVSTLLWLICGIILKDPWICCPQIASLCSLSVALYLVWRFPSDPAMAAIQGAREAMEARDVGAAATERQSFWARAIENAYNAASAAGVNVESSLVRADSTRTIRSYGTCDDMDEGYSGDTGGSGGSGGTGGTD